MFAYLRCRLSQQRPASNRCRDHKKYLSRIRVRIKTLCIAWTSLKSRGREVWVDWEDIRPTEDFMQAIYSAIEGADAFVFVLSPDSIASVVCGREIAHAVAHNKRLCQSKPEK
jgi:hypothetical protein